MTNEYEYPLDDFAIEKLAKRDWLEVLSDLWTAFGKEPPPDRLKIYARQLGYIPTGLLEQAVARAIRQQSYNTPPTVHAVFSALSDILGNPHDLDVAVASWVEIGWTRCVVRFDEVLT